MPLLQLLNQPGVVLLLLLQVWNALAGCELLGVLG
jgi:hypothetical protein